MKVMAGLESPEAWLLGLHMAILLLPVHVIFCLCVCISVLMRTAVRLN
jgi:hypothetical protein